MLARFALLVGLFVVPSLLLAVGHRMRERSDRTKRLFWGGVIGHALGVVVTMLVMMSPPVWWADAESVRTLAVYWAMIIGFGAGAVAGVVKG